MHDLEFLFCFPQKKKKGMYQTEFVFVPSKKTKGARISEFCFSFATERKKEICHASLIFHFLVGQNTMKSTEIFFIKKMIY